MTYAMSAFWHGFYPGFYIFFLSLPLLTACERLGRKKLSPRAEKIFGKKWYSPWGLTTIFFTEIAMVYFGSPFMIQSGEWSFAILRSNYFVGHIASVIFLIVVGALPTPKSEEKSKTI